MYLRHETGHALNYAYELWRRKDWTQTFGDFRRPYRDVYNPNPWTRDYVRYLHRTGMYHYAQKHPTRTGPRRSRSGWTRARAGGAATRDWQVALAKLEYVDRIDRGRGRVPGPGAQPPPGRAHPLHRDQGDGGRVLQDHRTSWTRTWRSTASDLLEIFPRRRAPQRRGDGQDRGDAQSAARFIQQHQRLLVDRLAGWIDDSDRRVIEQFLRQLEALCTSERLVVPENRRTRSWSTSPSSPPGTSSTASTGLSE